MENRRPDGRQGSLRGAGSGHRGPVQGAPDRERGALGGGGAAVAGPDWQPKPCALRAVDGAQDSSEQGRRARLCSSAEAPVCGPWSGCTL